MLEVAAPTLRRSLVLFARSCEAADAVEKVTLLLQTTVAACRSRAGITDETVFADFAIHGSSLTIFLVRVMVRREFLNLSNGGVSPTLIFGESAWALLLWCVVLVLLYRQSPTLSDGRRSNDYY
jgi:hypothetical protein